MGLKRIKEGAKTERTGGQPKGLPRTLHQTRASGGLSSRFERTRTRPGPVEAYPAGSRGREPDQGQWRPTQEVREDADQTRASGGVPRRFGRTLTRPGPAVA